VTTQSDDRVGESVSAAFLPAYIISQAKARNERDPEFARPADGAAEGEEGTLSKEQWADFSKKIDGDGGRLLQSDRGAGLRAPHDQGGPHAPLSTGLGGFNLAN
jgi:hypothetical protein